MASSCSTCSPQGCPTATVAPSDGWLEQEVAAGFRIWHLMFLSVAGLMTCVVMLCCCIRFRIPRTKQEIEADYVRKKLTKKFQKQLKAINNSEMDDMDLKRALDRVRAEFKSDTESGATYSSCPSPPGLGRRQRNSEANSYVPDTVPR